MNVERLLLRVAIFAAVSVVAGFAMRPRAPRRELALKQGVQSDPAFMSMSIKNAAVEKQYPKTALITFFQILVSVILILILLVDVALFWEGETGAGFGLLGLALVFILLLRVMHLTKKTWYSESETSCATNHAPNAALRFRPAEIQFADIVEWNLHPAYGSGSVQITDSKGQKMSVNLAYYRPLKLLAYLHENAAEQLNDKSAIRSASEQKKLEKNFALLSNMIQSQLAAYHSEIK